MKPSLCAKLSWRNSSEGKSQQPQDFHKKIMEKDASLEKFYIGSKVLYLSSYVLNQHDWELQ